MEKKMWTLVNSENVETFKCGDVYSSKQLLGDEIAGFPVINVNEGTLAPYSRTGGGAHEDCEIYYIVDGEGDVVLDDVHVPVKNHDFIVIPPHVFHWIDNTKSAKPFVIYTLWPTETQNEVFFARKEAWGTSIRYIDPDYTAKRIGTK